MKPRPITTLRGGAALLAVLALTLTACSGKATDSDKEGADAGE